MWLNMIAEGQTEQIVARDVIGNYLKEIPDYRNWKSTAGPNIAKAIGLNPIRKKCPHFDQWIRKLESLQPTGS